MLRLIKAIVAGRRMRLVQCMLVVAALTLPTMAAPPSFASHGSCGGTRVDDPHISSHYGGVAVSSTIVCTGAVDKLQFFLVLFYCGQTRPQTNNKQWLENNCSAAKYNLNTIYNLTANTVYSRTAPPMQLGSMATGWFYGVNTMTAYDRHNGSTSTQNYIKYSNAAKYCYPAATPPFCGIG